MVCFIDFNAHLDIWNCDKISINVRNPQDALDAKNLCIVNHDIKTHVSDRLLSNIDLCFRDSDLLTDIDYKTINDSLRSDHLPLEINIIVQNQEHNKFYKLSKELCNKYIDWELFRNLLIYRDDDYYTREVCNRSGIQKYELIVAQIEQAFVEANSRNNFSKNKTPTFTKYTMNKPTLWNAECDQAIALRYQLQQN